MNPLKQLFALVLCAFLSSGTLKADLLSGLSVWYEFRGNSQDSSGNGLVGEIDGAPVLLNDRFGRPDSAYSFASQNDSIDLSLHAENLFTSAAGTIVLSFRVEQDVTGANGAGSVILFLANTDLAAFAPQFLSLVLGDFTSLLQGEILGNLAGPGPPNPRSAVALSDLGPILASDWHQIAITSDADGHIFYFDGYPYIPTLFADGLSPAVNFWPFNPTNARIGGFGSANDIYRPFAVDDFRIYDRALMAEEIARSSLTACQLPMRVTTRLSLRRPLPPLFRLTHQAQLIRMRKISRSPGL